MSERAEIIDDLAVRVRALLDSGALDLPELGGGQTSERWRGLAAIARRDVSEGRLAEAHVDAVQILAEAQRPAAPGCLYGVWASEHPRWTMTAAATTGDIVELHGSKAFCTGAGLVDRALVSVRTLSPGMSPGPDPAPDGAAGHSTVLVEIDLSDLDEGRIDRSGWRTDAMAATSTAVVDFTGMTVRRSQIVESPNWYLDRAGFWDGAVGPAACWAGAATGLVDLAIEAAPVDHHAVAHVGAMAARAWELQAILDQVGRAIDEDQASSNESERSLSPLRPTGASDPLLRPTGRRARALALRHLVDAGCAEIQDRFARALGPRPLVADPAAFERDHALSLYRRQCHAERDLEALGRIVLTPEPPPT